MTVEDVDPEEQEKHRRRLEDHFGLPVVTILSEEGPRRMVEAVRAPAVRLVGRWLHRNQDP